MSEKIPFLKAVEDAAAKLKKEYQFRQDYATYAEKAGVAKNPDDKEHYYDYRAAWEAGLLKPDKENHLTSKFKLEGHPRLYMSPDQKKFAPQPQSGWLDTRTGAAAP